MADGGGTDANVTLTIVGENGDTGERKLSGSGNQFERGKTNSFLIEAADLGNLRKIRIGHDGSGIGSAWHLVEVRIRKAMPPNVQPAEWSRFVFNNWLKDNDRIKEIPLDTTGAASASASAVPSAAGNADTDAAGTDVNSTESERKDIVTNEEVYMLEIQTGSKRGAGTDAKVFVTLYGENSDSGERRVAGGSFESGKVDKFEFSALDLGKLTKLKIRHDNSGVGSAWFLDHVLVTCKNSGARYKFDCGRWLAKDEDDGLIERFLLPGDI